MVETKDVGIVTGGTIGDITKVTKVDLIGTISESYDGGVAWTPTRKFLESVQPSGTLWSPTAGKKAVMTDLMISALSSGTIELRSAGTLGVFKFGAEGGLVSNFKTPIEGTVDSLVRVFQSGGTMWLTALGREE